MNEKICMSCMNLVSKDASSCSYCGYNGSQQNPEIYLPIGYRLNNRYVIGRVEITEGDSTFYAGYDLQSSKRVEVREFLPVHGCSRNEETKQLIPKTGAELHYKTSLMDFSDLYKNLRKLSYEEAIVQTVDYFELNQTAYAVLEYFDGVTLREFLGLKSGIITFEQCMSIMDSIFDALNSIHSVNLTHRGVSPETIIISRTGEIKLFGFATTSVRTKGTDFACKLFSGYSAPEQYSTSMWQSTATDVYGLAASFYRCITGTAPQDADQRRVYDNLIPATELNSTIPAHVSKALMMAMLVDQQARTQTILAFKQMLTSAAEERQPQLEKVEEQQEEYQREDAIEDIDEVTPKRRYRGVKSLMVFSIIIFVLMLGVYFVLRGIGSKAGISNSSSLDFDDYLTVPSYSGRMLYELNGKFDTQNFILEIEPIFSLGEPEGKIINVSPPENSTIKKGDVITLYVNMTRVITMVDFTGLTYENAEMTLKELGIGKDNYQIIQEEAKDEYDYTVFMQSVEPGEEFNVQKDIIILTIAINPQGVNTDLEE